MTIHHRLPAGPYLPRRDVTVAPPSEVPNASAHPRRRPHRPPMIVRVGSRRRFTVVDNFAVEDPRLSFQALGLLTFLLSKPDNWEVSYRHLARVRTGPRGEGEHAVRKTLDELEAHGYLVRRRQRSDAGTWAWVSTVYEVPTDRPCGGNRGMDEPGRENRGRDNHRKTKTPLPTTTDEQRSVVIDSQPLDRITGEAQEQARHGVAAARAAIGRDR